MRFDDRVTGNLKTYAPNAKKIHVDIDPSEINKNVPVDVAIVGDLREALRECCSTAWRRRDHTAWLAQHRRAEAATPRVRDIQNLPDTGTSTPRT